MQAERRSAFGLAILTLSGLAVTVWWARQTGWLTPEFWFGASFLALGWMVVADHFLNVEIRLPQAFHTLFSFEADAGVYRRLGVHVFKRVVPAGDYANRARRAGQPHYRVIRTRSDALCWARRTQKTEAAHLLHLVLLIPAVLLAASARRMVFAGALILLLIAFDLYPVLLQRYNRARISRLANRPVRHQSV